MLKTILSVIGAIALIVLAYLVINFGGMMGKVSKLHPDAMGHYMNMFEKVLDTGSSGEAMVRKVKINDDVSTEDAIDNMIGIAGDNNFLMVGDAKMSIKSSIKDPGGKRYIRILSFCAPSVAEQFIAYNNSFGSFMPCRILIVEDDEGNRWLYTMAMELMIYGGQPLPPEMLEMAKNVRSLMYGMMDAGATDGDYDPDEAQY
ncbi:MAG: Unknown protein [uncultured Sulfurovum sp.]|uniref:DUF302 domain-containing protein n=1 Tax=uncultured Sulfurovum sp. TaxID=269237 RepID=A0A6S6U022_9BACT|nr:MAG: Unknown protein [uncultured Sulfurovum sp.]